MKLADAFEAAMKSAKEPPTQEWRDMVQKLHVIQEGNIPYAMFVAQAVQSFIRDVTDPLLSPLQAAQIMVETCFAMGIHFGYEISKHGNPYEMEAEMMENFPPMTAEMLKNLN